MDFDAVDLGDQRVLVLRGGRREQERRGGEQAGEQAGAAQEGRTAGGWLKSIMALSLEMDGPRSEADGGRLVTQQPWLCNGEAAPKDALG